MIQIGSGGARRRGMLKFDTLESGFRANSSVVVMVHMRGEVVYVLARSIFSL